MLLYIYIRIYIYIFGLNSPEAFSKTKILEEASKSSSH